jgi:hypothetical protein
MENCFPWNLWQLGAPVTRSHFKKSRKQHLPWGWAADE